MSVFSFLSRQTSLEAMTPADIELMNSEFGKVASAEKLADRVLKMLTDQQGLALGCQVFKTGFSKRLAAATKDLSLSFMFI